jgi:antitoxin (DNA-binding transcriptional repressor) of toxin-antitoxin stability system
MSVVASRDLRNHTAEVLRQVAEGTTVTVTVNGEPIAEISRPATQRRNYLTHGDVLRVLDQQRPDRSLAADLSWISAGTTVDLGPPGQ